MEHLTFLKFGFQKWPNKGKELTGYGTHTKGNDDNETYVNGYGKLEELCLELIAYQVCFTAVSVKGGKFSLCSSLLYKK